MDPIASFSGLTSGIDWQSLVEQIVQVESRPVTIYEGKIDVAESRKSAWQAFETKVGDLNSAVSALADGSALDSFTTSVTSLTTATGGTPLSASAGAGAIPGTYQVEVLQLATNEKVGSDVYASYSEALGLSGEFLIGGVAVQVTAEDSLSDIVSTLNRANTGSNASGVSAALISNVSGNYQIVLTSVASGAEGIDLADGERGVLRSLGFLDSTTAVKNQTSNGARSDGLVSSSQTVSTLMGLSSSPSAGSVTLAAGSSNPFSVSLDLSSMSLSDIASAINTAAATAGSAVTASVVSETDDDGAVSFHLDIDGTTSFTDANGILETLGILEGGRGDVSQVIQSASAFTDGDASTTATASTLLSDLWVDGASASVSVGDTLSLSGTRGDGTTFTKTYTVGAGDTLQNLLDELNSATDGYGYGDRTATASIGAGGNLVVTDSQGGSSRLALSVVANNEGGGTLDFGDMSVSESGRSREIVAGQDAQIEVDGNFVSQSSNTITEVIPGVTMKLLSASENVATIDVTRDTNAVVDLIQGFVSSYNAVEEWVSDQFSGAGSEEGVENKPLSGDGVLRQMRSYLRSAMQTVLDDAVGGDMNRLGAIGVEITQDGTYEVDQTVLKAALESDPEAVTRLFGVFGSGSVSSLSYVDSGDETVSGDYDVEITQAATQGTVTGTGFGGTYVDDGTADTLTIKDLGTNSEYDISLSNGMTLTEIVSAINDEMGTPQVHQVQATEAMYSDAVGTLATDDTLLQDLYKSDGTSFGVADGDTLTFSGTLKDGSSFLETFSVTDVTSQTLGDLRASLASAVGSTETVTWESGLLTVTGRESGRSSMSLSISSDNAGGGSLTFGTVDTVTEGREAGNITASEDGGELKLLHSSYGSSVGFEISFAAGGADGSASLGITAGSYSGLDVAGTIGGYAATGSGQVLTGADDTDVAGLMIEYAGADTGSVGTMTFSRGVASALEVASDFLLGTGDGTIDGVLDGIDPLIEGYNTRIERLEAQIETRRQELIRRFAAMEEALASAQAQSQWIASQFSALNASSSQQ